MGIPLDGGSYNLVSSEPVFVFHCAKPRHRSNPFEHKEIVMAPSHPQHTDFFTAQPNEIATAQSFADIFTLIERTGLGVGGRGFTPERIVTLDHSLIGASSSHLHPVETARSLAVQIYLLAPEFCRSLVQTQHEALLKASVTWADSVVWQNIAINPFDLAGFLVSLQQLCQVAHQQNTAVYLLVSEDADWEPQSNVSE
jgi:hypothetical protein